MGLIDGAVNGMVSRLVQAGFTAPEGYCLAQTAYVKETKRAAGVPRAVLDRKTATWEINQALAALGAYPMGPEAHRQRIILWEKIFGRGSWHEPVAQEETYGPPSTATSEHAVAQPAPSPEEEEWEAIIEGALRYFDTVDLAFLGERFMAPATLYQGSGEEQRQWDGFVLAKDGMIGFFEESDCRVEDTDEGSPLIYKLNLVESCQVRMPADVYVPTGLDRISLGEPATNMLVKVAFENVWEPMQIAILFEDLEASYKEQAAQNMQQFLLLLNRTLQIRHQALD